MLDVTIRCPDGHAIVVDITRTQGGPDIVCPRCGAHIVVDQETRTQSEPGKTAKPPTE